MVIIRQNVNNVVATTYRMSGPNVDLNISMSGLGPVLIEMRGKVYEMHYVDEVKPWSFWQYKYTDENLPTLTFTQTNIPTTDPRILLTIAPEEIRTLYVQKASFRYRTHTTGRGKKVTSLILVKDRSDITWTLEISSDGTIKAVQKYSSVNQLLVVITAALPLALVFAGWYWYEEFKSSKDTKAPSEISVSASSTTQAPTSSSVPSSAATLSGDSKAAAQPSAPSKTA